MILEIKVDDYDVKYMAERVFFKSIDLVGGLDRLANYRTLTWLPSLARAAFVIVLREEYLKTEEEIAKFVGISTSTVKQILRADPNAAIYKIRHLEDSEKKELKVHTAGGIAKLAYKSVKNGEDSQTMMEYCRAISQEAVAQCDTPWAYLVLKNIKGLKYPLTEPQPLIQRLKNLEIKGVDAKEIVHHLHYPIKNPAELLKEIKEQLLMKGIE